MKNEFNVSLFKNFLNRETIVNCSMEHLARIIREGRYAAALTDYRCYIPFERKDNLCVSSAKEVKSADNRIPRVCFSSVFRRRNGCRMLIERNSLLFIKMAGLNSFDEARSLRREASRQPYTMMAFVGADGLSVIIVCAVAYADGSVPSDAEEWGRMMAEGYRRLSYVYSSQLRKAVIGADRFSDAMCLVSADAGVYYNAGAIAMSVDADGHTPAFCLGGKFSPDADESPIPGKSPSEAYRYIFYCCWNRVLDSGIDTAGTYYAEDAVKKLASLCHKSGLPLQMCIDRTMALDGINADRSLVELIFVQAYRQTISEPNPLRCVEAPRLMAIKLDNFFKTNYVMRRNVLTGVVQYKRAGACGTEFNPVTQEVINTIAVEAQRNGIKVWARDIKERVNSTLVADFDPLNDWLLSLPQWDGRDRLKAFALRVPTDNPRWPEYFGVWMRSMVAHWMGLDVMHGNDLVPLLIGSQGCGKSSFAKIILPPELRAYYNDRIDFRNDNTLMRGLSSFALINIDEFDRYSAGRQPLMKYLISKSEVTAVKAYRSTFSTDRRYASFIATTNSLQPLTDPTGSRRFACVAVNGNIDFTSKVDYGQLYAQVRHEIRSGASCYLDHAATEQLMDYNSRFMRITDLASAIARLFRIPESDGAGHEMSVDGILSAVCRAYPCLPVSKLTDKGVGIAMKRLGFSRRHTRSGALYMVEQIVK